MLLDSKKFRKQLESELSKSSRCICYSAFFTEKASKWLIEKRSFLSEDRLLIRALPADFSAGACSINAIKAVLLHGLTVKMSSALHAKIYAFDDYVYSGSANLTARGLALIDTHNQELGTKTDLCLEDLKLLEHLWIQAVPITSETLTKMETFLEDQQNSNSNEMSSQISWPEEIFQENRDLYCSDFPQDYPSDDIRWCNETALKQSAAYNWLRNTIENEGEARFGFLSSKLHDIIFDDPAPYRREIKELLANLLEVVKDLDASKLEVFRPNHSQVVRLRTDLNQ